MEGSEFQEFTKAMTDFLVDYFDNIRERPVLPDVKMGFMRSLLPEKAPQQAENWQDVMKDIDRVIMPGITHWISPHFHAYYPMATSFPSIVAGMLTDGLATVAFSWMACPAATELEVIMMDWLGKMLGLPGVFLSSAGGTGGGVIQGSASEACLVALLGAKAKKIRETLDDHPEWSEDDVVPKLVAYCSTQTHSSVEKACLLAGIKLRILSPDDSNKLLGETLEAAFQEDIANGFIPCYAAITLGTTNSCAFDRLDECGPLGNQYGVWIHVDAAYAGSAFICPEYRHLMKGVETVDSFNFNPHKLLMITFDCSALWLKNPSYVVDSFKVEAQYLKYEKQGSAPDFRHWQIPLSRRFRALKLWFVLRLYGVENLQAHIRRHCSFAKQFERLCRADERFEITNEVQLGLVCFRLRGGNDINEALLKRINDRRKIYIVSAKICDILHLRMVPTSRLTTTDDMDFAWQEVKISAEEVIQDVVTKKEQFISIPKPIQFIDSMTRSVDCADSEVLKFSQ